MEFTLYLIVGFAILIVAGDLLVRGSVSLAEHFGIPSIVIGLTIVAFGTSAPELMISLKAALTGHGGISIGNVVGSNIANILLVLGLPALIKAIPCGGVGSARNAGFMIVVTGIFIACCWYQPFTYIHGIVLLLLLAVFLTDSVIFSRKQRALGIATQDPLDEVDGRTDNLTLAGVFLVIGLIGLPIGGHLAVNGAIGIATLLGVSETAIALSVVAIGTSLPEVVTAIIAARKGQIELAMGNVIGSNVFNILAIIGTTALVTPIYTPERIQQFDLWVMAGTSAFLLPFVFRCIPISRRIGAMMLLSYAVYLFMVFKLEV
ncbi:MAG: calcium/sodium antiporter [Hyphomicrobiales bacterium]